MKLSIVIPVFNEEKTVFQLIQEVKKVDLGKRITKEIIVIDDGSEDNSSKILARMGSINLITHKYNTGKGSAVQSGFKKASGDIILIQDADLEYDPRDYKKLIEPIVKTKCKVVYGTRLAKEAFRIFGKNKTPLPLHYLGNIFLTAFTNMLYGSSLTDMETCYKVFSAEVIKPMKLKSKKFDIEPEITAKILKQKINILEVPIKVKPRDYSEGKKITWKDGAIAVWTLVKYRFVN